MFLDWQCCQTSKSGWWYPSIGNAIRLWVSAWVLTLAEGAGYSYYYSIIVIIIIIIGVIIIDIIIVIIIVNTHTIYHNPLLLSLSSFIVIIIIINCKYILAVSFVSQTFWARIKALPLIPPPGSCRGWQSIPLPPFHNLIRDNTDHPFFLISLTGRAIAEIAETWKLLLKGS